MSISGRARVVLVPAAVFQSVIFGGAYGTGREVAEFITAYGPLGGLLALAEITAVFIIVLTLCFELARVLRAYDYRTFLKALIGRGWVAYELLLIVSAPLVLAVNGSAAGTIMRDQVNLPASVGVGLLLAAVIAFSYYGRRAVQNSMVFLAAGLLLILSITGVVVVGAEFGNVGSVFSSSQLSGGWPVSALNYSLYNVAIIPVILYCARGIESTGESFLCGVAAGIAGVFPAVVFHVAFVLSGPEILQQPLPIYTVLQRMANPAFFWVYVTILFFMIMSTAVGLLHGLNERLDAWHVERAGVPLSARARARIGLLIMIVSLALSEFGIIELVAQGYGALGWAYLFVFVLPLLFFSPAVLFRMSRRLQA